MKRKRFIAWLLTLAMVFTGMSALNFEGGGEPPSLKRTRRKLWQERL